MANTSRLRTEYQHIRKLESRSRHIRLKTTIGSVEAPEKYVVTYTCKGVVGIDDFDEPLFSSEHELEVDLTNFPESPPRMKFRTRVFHPGVEDDEPYHIALRKLVPSWDTQGSVAEALVNVGHMLQYERYRDWMESPVNQAAANWVSLVAEPRGLILAGRPLDGNELVEGERQVLAAVAPQPTASAEDDAPAADPSAPVTPDTSAIKPDPDETLVTARPLGAAAKGPQAGAVAAMTTAPAHGATSAAAASSAPQAGHAANGQRSEKPKLVFGDLTREDEAPFPLPRLLHWKPTGKKYDVKEPPFSLVVTSEVLATINAHVSMNVEKELGGFLLGNRYICPNSKIKYVQIDNCPDAKFATSKHVSIELVNETFQHFLDEKGGKYRGKEVVGWYHSHPDMGVFLSSPMDVDVHKVRFPAPWQVALVVDPVRREGGFFCWRDGEPHQHAMMDFYELRGIKTPATQTYMPWVNYQCFDSQTGEEREPQLAEGARPIVIIREGRLDQLKTWLREHWWYLGAAAALLLILVAGTGRWGLFGSDVDQPAVAKAIPKGRGEVTANTAVTETPARPARPSPPPATLPEFPAPRVVGACEGYQCTVTAKFKERVEGLRVVIDGRYYLHEWEGSDAVIELRDASLTRTLRSPGAASTVTLSVTFSDPSHSEVSVPVALVPEQLPPPAARLTAAELARLRRAEQRREQSRSAEGAGRGKATGTRRDRDSGARDRTRH